MPFVIPNVCRRTVNKEVVADSCRLFRCVSARRDLCVSASKHVNLVGIFFMSIKIASRDSDCVCIKVLKFDTMSAYCNFQMSEFCKIQF